VILCFEDFNNNEEINVLWMGLPIISPMDSNVIALMMLTMKVVWGKFFYIL
jgi:hypothetical protein